MRPLNSIDFISVLILLLFILCGCTGEGRRYTECEEECEYVRRDCVELCGGGNSFGFSVDFSSKGFSGPYACTDKCEIRNKRCLSRCDGGKRRDE